MKTRTVTSTKSNRTILRTNRKLSTTYFRQEMTQLIPGSHLKLSIKASILMKLRDTTTCTILKESEAKSLSLNLYLTTSMTLLSKLSMTK